MVARVALVLAIGGLAAQSLVAILPQENQMNQRKLYLEQRIAIVRRRLNEDTIGFQEGLPEEMQPKFNAFILSCMSALDGMEHRMDELTTKEKEWFGIR